MNIQALRRQLRSFEQHIQYIVEDLGVLHAEIELLRQRILTDGISNFEEEEGGQ